MYDSSNLFNRIWQVNKWKVNMVLKKLFLGSSLLDQAQKLGWKMYQKFSNPRLDVVYKISAHILLARTYLSSHT